MKPARITPCAMLRPNARVTSTPNTAAAIAALLIGALPGRRRVEPLLAPLAGDLLGVLARLRPPRAARRARSFRRACRDACVCACAWSGPSTGDVTGRAALSTARRSARGRPRAALSLRLEFGNQFKSRFSPKRVTMIVCGSVYLRMPSRAVARAHPGVGRTAERRLVAEALDDRVVDRRAARADAARDRLALCEVLGEDRRAEPVHRVVGELAPPRRRRCTLITGSVGPNVSSRMHSMSWFTSTSTVGS